MDNLKPITFEELMAKQFPKETWLLEGLIPENCITMIVGSPASFKTYLLLDLVICMASGEKFLGHFEAKKSKALFIDAEIGERMLQDRIRKLTDKKDLGIEILSLSEFRISDTDEIIDYCQEKGIEVIIIDSLIRIHSNEENSSTEMSRLFNEFKKFKTNGLSVIFTHHNRKISQNRPQTADDARGSSEITAFVDASISIRRSNKKQEKDEILITPTKLRIAKEAEPFNVAVTEDESSTLLKFELTEMPKDKPGVSKIEIAQEKIISLLKEEADKEMNQKEIINSLKNVVGESTIKGVLGLLEE